MVATLNILPKPRSRKGVKFQPDNTQGVYNATVTAPHKGQAVGATIRIWGTCTNRVTPTAFDRSFKVGDMAEYGSFNLKYNGKILAIGPKTIKIDASSTGGKVRSLDLFEFIDRNWDFDQAKSEAYNAEEARCL